MVSVQGLISDFETLMSRLSDHVGVVFSGMFFWNSAIAASIVCAAFEYWPVNIRNVRESTDFDAFCLTRSLLGISQMRSRISNRRFTSSRCCPFAAGVMQIKTNDRQSKLRNILSMGIFRDPNRVSVACQWKTIDHDLAMANSDFNGV